MVFQWRVAISDLALRQYDRLHWHDTPNPSSANIYSPSVKTTIAAGVRWFDASKRVDTSRNCLDGVAHAANIHDYHGAKRVLCEVIETVETFRRI